MAQVNKIWLSMGQSWSAGQTDGILDLQAEYTGLQINTRILKDGVNFSCIDSTLNNNQFPLAYKNNGCSIEFYFKDIADLLGRDVYIVKCAKGGAGLAQDAGIVDWNVASVAELYDEAIAAIQNAKTWMDNRGKSYIFEGLIWWQGEQDSKTLVDANAYQTNLTNLFNDIVTETGNANLKIYQYDIIDPPSLGRPYKAEVNSGKLAFTNLDTNNRRLFTPTVIDWNIDDKHPSVDGYLKIWDDYQKPLIIADL